MIIDTHSHVQFRAFDMDADKITKKTLADNIWMINVGTKFQTSQRGVEFAEKYPEGVFAAIGLHPMHAAAEFIKMKTDPDEEENLALENEFDAQKYRALAQSKKVVAIGEIGLDYYYKPKTTAKLAEFKEKQKRVFTQQLDLAKELNLPVILHCRMAHDDVIEILKERGENRGVIHCFTGTLEQAQKYIAMGFYIGINGIIFKFNIDDTIKAIPLGSIVVETDCPYLTPLPAIALATAGAPEGKTRNEPIFIKHTIQKIADLRSVAFDEVAEKTTENARKLFNI
ncbi:TatD family hydrolase [Candidatus Parcubacteria bacterium]|nr:TatD family hydrolase [Candidatus Parcubacteria bacterium]